MTRYTPRDRINRRALESADARSFPAPPNGAARRPGLLTAPPPASNVVPLRPRPGAAGAAPGPVHL